MKKTGATYVGDFEAGIPSGKGTIMYKDKCKFDGKHHNFSFETGEFQFADGERHEGAWIDNCPGKDGLRKYMDGRRSQQGMMVIRKGRMQPRYKVYFVINNGIRVVEDWAGSREGTVRESVEFIPVTALQYEEALIRACSTGSFANVSKVLKDHPILAKHALDSSENKCAPCLVVAAANGHVDIAKVLLMNGADAECADVDMHNAFHAAAFFAHANVMKVLCYLTKSPNDTLAQKTMNAMNSRSESNETPLHMAVNAFRQDISGADECVRLLIIAGADPGDLEQTSAALDPQSLVFNTLLFMIPPTTDVLIKVSYFLGGVHMHTCKYTSHVIFTHPLFLTPTQNYLREYKSKK